MLPSPTNKKDETESLGDSDHHPRKRQRVRLSCLECRRRKLSCDRGFPCERCVKSGTPDLCTYEGKTAPTPLNVKSGIPAGAFSTSSAAQNLDRRGSLSAGTLNVSGDASNVTAGLYRRELESAAAREQQRDHDRIRKLELEVATLKNLLSSTVTAAASAGRGILSTDGSTVVADNSPADQRRDAELPAAGDDVVIPQTPPPYAQDGEHQQECHAVDKDELRFFKGKEFKTRYFGPHNACMAFQELHGLCGFMRETAHEWLKPLNVQRPKDRCARRDERERKFLEGDDELDSLLPAKGEVDELVELYLVQFEQLHRVLHVPTFRREYAKYWGPGPKYAAFTALILSIMAISNCLSTTAAAKFTGMTSNLHENAAKYIRAVEEWSRKQSHKHRKLIHYQIACLLYLAKRVNTYKKKRFWSSSGALVQDGIGVGLHRDPSHIAGKISPYNQEMRRRLWSTMQEFDLQTSYDLGLPTLLSQLHYDAQPPRNVDDEEFDEDSKELPPSKPTTCYTHTSYQHLSRQSLPLRLELSRFLTGPPRDEIDYDQVVRYTNDIVQEIDCLPSWTTEDDGSGDGSLKKQPLLSYTLLHIQLRQYIIPLHQPYLRLRKTNPKYQYSEIIYYNAARDIVLLHDKLAAQGIRALYFLREDILTAAMNLCHVTLLQPRGMSTNMIMINSQHTLRLVEKCLALKEDRILRCGNHEPWGYSIMCAALGLLETHLGTRTAEAAKGAAAERFVNLHYKLLAFQDPPLSVMAMPPFSSQQTDSTRAPIPSQESFMERAKSMTPFLFPSSQGSATQVAAGGGLGGDGAPPSSAPWLLGLDPGVPPNPDFNLDVLGLNINELWGDSWDYP